MHLPHQRSSAWQPLPPRGGEAKEQAEHALQLTTLEFCCIIRIHLNHGSKLHQNGGPLGGNRKLLLFLSPLWLVGKNIVKCERYPGTRGFDLIEGKQPKSEWNIWRQIKVVYSFQVELSPRQQALAVYSQSSQVFCSDAFSEMEDHWPAFWALKRYFLCSLMLRLHPTTFFPSSFPRFLQTSHNFCWLLIIGGDMIRLHNLPTIAMYWLTTPLACFISFAFLGLFEELLYTCRWLYAIHYIPHNQCIFEKSHKIRINSSKHPH